MSKQLSTCQKIRWAVKYCPTVLPSMLTNNHLNKRITLGIMRELIPRRTSIEIECMGTIVKENAFRGLSKKEQLKYAKKYGIYMFNIDPLITKGDYTEHKISILNSRQLVGLYRILRDMHEKCAINTISGCHIHIDINHLAEHLDFSNRSRNKLASFIDGKLADGTIEKILGEYNGSFNNQKWCGIDDKHCWVTLRQMDSQLFIEQKDHGWTIEFRTAPQTFDYSTVVEWFIKLNKLINEFENKLLVSTIQRENSRMKRQDDVLYGPTASQAYPSVTVLHPGTRYRVNSDGTFVQL